MLAIGAMGAEIIVKVAPPRVKVEERSESPGGRATSTRMDTIAGTETNTNGHLVNGNKRRTNAPNGWTIAGIAARTVTCLPRVAGRNNLLTA
jgi:hypothetical protein